MTIAAALSAYVDELSELPEETLLGVLALYTVRETRDYNRDEIAALLAAQGLPEELLPKADNPLNDWKSATWRINEHTYVMPSSIGGQPSTGFILARPVVATEYGYKRLLVREIRNDRDGTLSHDTVAECRFYRPTRSQGKIKPDSERCQVIIQSASLLAGEQGELERIREIITTEHTRLKATISAAKVRQMVRDTLRWMGGTPVRLSVWFVHTSRADDVRKLKAVVQSLECELDRIPLLRLKESRMMLIRAVEDDTVDELRKLVQEISRVRSTRAKVSGHVYSNLKARYDQIMGQAQLYTEWLETGLDTAGSAAEAAVLSLRAMQQAMLAGAGGTGGNEDDEGD